MKRRLVGLSLVLFALFSVVMVQYYLIQIVDGEKWSKLAQRQHEILVKVPFKRGIFFSNPSLRSGHLADPEPLVLDLAKFHLYADPFSIPEKYKQEVGEQLIEIASLPEKTLDEVYKKSRSRKLAMWLDREIQERVLTWWKPYARARKIPPNALYFVSDYKRSYPHGKLLGQVLHTIREVKEETTEEGLPTGGLESYFNEVLKGKLGKRKLLRSPLNQLEIDSVIEPPEDGADLYLTIDSTIQAIVEGELEKGVVAAKAKGGWAVMMDPHSGEILALAQYPFFDPSRYRDYFNDPTKIEDTKVKAITDPFEVGSIMKPITIAIGLQANDELAAQGKPPLFDPEEKIDVTRQIFPGRASRPLHDTPPQLALNLDMAIYKSSNIYMAQVIEQVIATFGNEWYRKKLVEGFGFGTKTGIELPAETVGMVPTPGKLHPNGALEWSTPTPFSLAIGYNILATSTQMARAFAVLANGGYLVEPTLVKKIVRDGEVLEENPPSPSFPRVLEETVVKRVVRALKFSTQAGGWGRRGAIGGYTEAAKTGTAEKIQDGVYNKKQHISSFVGFTPVEKSRFVLIVTLDEPAPIVLEDGVKNFMGGRCAAPVFATIATRTLDYLGVTPDDPFGYPVGDPRYDPEKADYGEEIRKLQSLYNEWNKK
ncbi:MAG: Penicillin-binding protein 2 [Chlamydiae bacterium]|nr:Penicillin-binding protein 2 [Chlamydiota bacterium]